MSETSMANRPETHQAKQEKAATQLRLLPSGAGRLEWSLDERTRTVGRRGVAEAREILRRHQPPQPVDAWSKAS